MNISQIVITATLTTFTLIALGVVVTWSLWPQTAEAGVTVAAHTANWHRSSNHCERLSSGHLELGQAVVTVALDLDEAQQVALDPVRASLESWRSQIASLCESVDHDTMDVDSGLQSLEQVLAISTTAVANLRPHLSTFVAGLTPEQNEKLMSYVHNHQGRGGFHAHDH